MPTAEELMRMRRDVDAYKGNVCRRCTSWRAKRTGGRPNCIRGMIPLDETDGCDDWQSAPRNDKRKMAAFLLSI